MLEFRCRNNSSVCYPIREVKHTFTHTCQYTLGGRSEHTCTVYWVILDTVSRKHLGVRCLAQEQFNSDLLRL